MAGRSLQDCRILVVEDEYLLAEELAQELSDAGALVIGPASSIARAMALLEPPSRPDGAILDVNLAGEPVFPLADTLIGRGIPLVFTTGYDRATLPKRFAAVPICEKPIHVGRILAMIDETIRR